MKKSLLLTLAILLFPALAHAQVAIRFGWTAPPPVVEVSPGVQVVENGNEEVFFTNGHYWVERDGRWYWANDYREHWVPVRGPIPVFLRDHRRGQYAHWRHEEHAEMRHEERREERHEERREIKHEEHREGEHREAEHREERREERHE